MTRTWPEDWDERKLGEGCDFCNDGGAKDRGTGVRFFCGSKSEAYLQREGPAPGYSIVVFRGRHVADLTRLLPDELTAFWADVQQVARVIDAVFSPCHLNYQVLGNAAPHVHVHITPRYLDDPAPQRPLTFADRYEVVPPEEFARQLDALVIRLSDETAMPISVKGVVPREGKVVLLRNEREEWELPGGKLEADESPEECVVREIAEECALNVAVVAPLEEWIYQEIRPFQSVRIVTFGCRECSLDEAILSDEHQELRWVALEKVPGLVMPQGYKDSIASWAKMESDAGV